MNSNDYVRMAIANGDTELEAIINGRPLPQGTDRNPSRDRSKIITDLLILRYKAGMSQHDLAVKLGVSQSTLARIEAGRGNPTLKTLQKIAMALNAEVRMRSGG
jgi:DNA-binding XRE family transcriptional regulator